MDNIDEYSIDYRNCDCNTINYSKFSSKLPEAQEYNKYEQTQPEDNKQSKQKEIKQKYPKLNTVQRQDAFKESYLAKCLLGAFLLISIFITVSVVSTCISEHISHIASIDVFAICDNASNFV